MVTHTPDDLFTLKNQFWVGNYQTAISEGLMLKGLSEGSTMEKKFYLYRSYIAMKQYKSVLNEITEQEGSVGLAAVRLLAVYLMNKSNATGSNEILLLTLNEWLSDAVSSENPYLLLIAGIILGLEERYSEAFSILSKGNTLEHEALLVQLCLKMDRIDVAERHVAKMHSMEDDSTLTQIATAWLHIANGSKKCDESALFFQELEDRFGASTLLLNGRAVAHMNLRNFTEAERLLNEANNKEPADADTLINLITVSRHLGKTEEHVQTLMKSLIQVQPTHPYLESFRRLEAAFDRLGKAMA